MDKIEKSRIENNSLKAEIETILQLRDEAEAKEEGNDSFSFAAPIDEEEMSSWEQETGIKIPESYKEWLRFSRESRINGNTARFWSPKRFHSKYVPDDLVIIGEMIGDGEFIGFSKKNRHFVRYFEGKIRSDFKDFNGLLKYVIQIIKGHPVDSKWAEKMLKRIAELEREKK